MACNLVITPEEFDRYEYEINNVLAKEAEQEEEVVHDFLEFIESCNHQKRLAF